MTVDNRGEATVVLVRHDEHFTFTFPSAEACDILSSKPWLQLAGQTSLTASTGARATFTFSGKDWVDGELMAENGSERWVTVKRANEGRRLLLFLVL